MRIYKVHVCMFLVITKLKKYDLEDYNSIRPIIFVEADDPDGACFNTLHKLAGILLKHSKSARAINFVRDILNDVRILKVECPNEA